MTTVSLWWTMYYAGHVSRETPLWCIVRSECDMWNVALYPNGSCQLWFYNMLYAEGDLNRINLLLDRLTDHNCIDR